MLEPYYTIVEAAAVLKIHPEYVRALLARLPKVSPPAYRRFGCHPRLVRVIPERDVRLLQDALIQVKPTVRRPLKASGAATKKKNGRATRVS